MKPLGTPWTDAELATIVAMRQAGNPMAIIAVVLDRSFESVSSKVGNLTSSIHGPRLAERPTQPQRHQYRSRAEFLTSNIMGDPAPGRSALDQRQA